MGKQVRFYMMPEDELAFLRFVCQDQNVVLLADSSPTPELEIIKDLLSSPRQRSKLETVLIWNKAFPLRDNDVREIHLTEYKGEIGAFIETGKVIYSVNTPSAYVVEFSPSFVRGSELVKGRIWANMYRLEGDALVYKGKDFESWYDRIAQWLRRNFKRIRGVDGYLGPQALKWYQGGGKLSRN